MTYGPERQATANSYMNANIYRYGIFKIWLCDWSLCEFTSCIFWTNIIAWGLKVNNSTDNRKFSCPVLRYSKVFFFRRDSICTALEFVASRVNMWKLSVLPTQARYQTRFHKLIQFCQGLWMLFKVVGVPNAINSTTPLRECKDI